MINRYGGVVPRARARVLLRGRAQGRAVGLEIGTAADVGAEIRIPKSH